MHQVQFMTIKDPTPCHYHHLSYFCGHYMGLNNNLRLCSNVDHVPKWTLTKLHVFNSIKVRDEMHDLDEEVEAKTRGKWIVENLLPSDNIVVVSNDEEQFWLMGENLLKCTTQDEKGIVLIVIFFYSIF